MQRPLRDDVARPARAYLTALVAGAEVGDAWHELLSDVAYWGEGELLPVLRLAHQVVRQHERVAPEVAALALAEVGVDDPADVAVVLDADVAAARRWTAQARACEGGDASAVPSPSPSPSPSAGRLADRARPESTARHPDPVPAAEPTPEPEPVPEPEAAAEPAAQVRIGFDEDGGPPPDLDGARGPRMAGRPLVWLGLVLVVAVVVGAWALAVQ